MSGFETLEEAIKYDNELKYVFISQFNDDVKRIREGTNKSNYIVHTEINSPIDPTTGNPYATLFMLSNGQINEIKKYQNDITIQYRNDSDVVNVWSNRFAPLKLEEIFEALKEKFGEPIHILKTSQ